MFTRDFHPSRFLRSVVGTAPFRAFCQRRGLPDGSAGVAWWAEALASTPGEWPAALELELAKVNELSTRDGVAHLLDAAAATGRSVPPDTVPSGAATALWFFVHEPELFHEVLLHHEIREAHAWRVGKAAACLSLRSLTETADALAAGLKTVFRRHDGAGRYCAVDARRLKGDYCFTAFVADRLRLLDTFSEGGAVAVRRVRPAVGVLFTYSPGDGLVLLRTHLRSVERVQALFRCFGQAALRSPVAPVGEVFNLDRLLRPFHPLPDAPDMESVRVKSLHLRYPARLGGRQVKLDTLTSDTATAIAEMLRDHVSERLTAADLRVVYAELQVRLRAPGSARNHIIRLWPDRSSLNHTALSDRFRACLRTWGLTHAHCP